MAPFGKALRFYCRHAAEMTYLCDSETPDISGLEDGDKVLEMARVVGEQAKTEAASLVLECGEKIRSYFESIGFRIGKEPKEPKVRREWRWYGILQTKTFPDLTLECGTQVSPKGRAIVPYLWRRKGRHWRNEVYARLGTRADLESSDPLETGGSTIHLPSIPIPIEGAPLDRAALIRDAVSRFQAITAEDVYFMGRDTDD